MGFKNQESNLDAVARGNDAHRRETESVRARLALLESHTGLSAVNTQKRAPIADAPARASFKVTPKPESKCFVIHVQNPEFKSPFAVGNAHRRTILHRLRYSPYADFSREVTEFPPSPQTYYPIHEDPATGLHFEISSSHDGINWNLPTRSGKVGS